MHLSPCCCPGMWTREIPWHPLLPERGFNLFLVLSWWFEKRFRREGLNWEPHGRRRDVSEVLDVKNFIESQEISLMHSSGNIPPLPTPWHLILFFFLSPHCGHSKRSYLLPCLFCDNLGIQAKISLLFSLTGGWKAFSRVYHLMTEGSRQYLNIIFLSWSYLFFPLG